MAEVPEQYGGKFFVVVNDRDFDVAARNAILLLIAMAIEDETEAVDCMIHVWYSALITEKHSNVLTNTIHPIIEEVNEKIKDKSAEKDFTKKFSFGTRSLRLTLKKSGWKALLSFFSAPSGLSAQQAQKIRKATTLAPSRVDFRERKMLTQSPISRVCETQFRSDGVLLPFGASRDDHIVPNPTFFQSKSWPMMDNANPLDCWSLPDILKTEIGPATNDIYGKLYCLLQSILRKFHRRLASSVLDVELYCVDVKELPSYVKEQKFARIEVANICDRGYLGTARTIDLFGPMLQSPSDNARATLITLFLNAIHEVGNEGDVLMMKTELDRVAKYMGIGKFNRPTSPDDPKMLAVMGARDCVRDGDPLFNKYMIEDSFRDIERFMGVQMKEPHTIIEKWPMKLKMRPGEKGAKEEFDLLFSSGHVGTERYVEWRRAE